MSKITKTRERFIEQSIEIHGNKYDYSKVDYKKYNVEVCIICCKHGEFWQKPSVHLVRSGCQKCKSEKRTKTPNQIIDDFVSIHGNKYNYSKVNYIIDSEKVCIICPEHGEFWQEPGSHKRGVGCPTCYECIRTKSKENFIKEAREIHGNKYDYSKTDYINSKFRICVVCPEHGEFYPIAKLHIKREHGCHKCQMNKKTEIFIKDAMAVHGDKYGYSKVNYISADRKVCIICKKHGEFWQIAKNHLNGYRCSKCSKIVLKDGTVCDSQAEAYMCLQHKKNNIPFLHNKRYGKELGGMRFDFYFPSLNVYEEITSYDFRDGHMTSIEKRIKSFYLEKIDKKRKFVESKGGRFNFIELKLTRDQQKYIFANSIT